MQASDGGLLFSWRRVPKQTRLERKGNKRENGGRRGTPESRVEVCASANLSDRGLKGGRGEETEAEIRTWCDGSGGRHDICRSCYTYQRSEQDAALYFVSR